MEAFCDSCVTGLCRLRCVPDLDQIPNRRGQADDRGRRHRRGRRLRDRGDQPRVGGSAVLRTSANGLDTAGSVGGELDHRRGHLVLVRGLPGCLSTVPVGRGHRLPAGDSARDRGRSLLSVVTKPDRHSWRGGAGRGHRRPVAAVRRVGAGTEVCLRPVPAAGARDDDRAGLSGRRHRDHHRADHCPAAHEPGPGRADAVADRRAGFQRRRRQRVHLPDRQRHIRRDWQRPRCRLGRRLLADRARPAVARAPGRR